MRSLIRQIIDSIPFPSMSDAEGDLIQIDDKCYRPLPISKNNFHPIAPVQEHRNTAFIDGGNAEVLSGPDFSLHLIRTAVTFSHIKDSDINEFFCLTKIDQQNNYTVEIFPDSKFPFKLSFDPKDSELKEGKKSFKISRTAGIVRRLAELNAAVKSMSKLNSGDFILIDGTLQKNFPNEDEFIKALLDTASGNNVIVASLAKTTRLVTNKGFSAVQSLSLLADQDTWFYHPVAEPLSENCPDIFFVKLNRSSRFIFRFETFSSQDAEKIISNIARDSNDVMFPGYPNGLIKADRFARISGRERSYYSNLFRTKLGKRINQIRYSLSTVSAHDILDQKTPRF